MYTAAMFRSFSAKSQLRGLESFSLCVAACLLGVFLTFRPTLLSGFQWMQTDPGDTRLNNYFLEHGYLWITGHPLHSTFWNPPFYYPEKNVLAYSDTLLGVAPFYWVVRALGFLPDTAYQLWTILLLGIDFGVAYWVLRQIRFGRFPAIAGSYLFAFANIRTSQLGHAQLLPQFFNCTVLLGLYALFEGTMTWPWIKSFDQRNRFWILVIAASTVAQIYAGFYLGWFTVFGFTVLTTISLFFSSSRSALWAVIHNHWIFLLCTGLVAFLILYPMGYHYWLASHEVGMRSFSAISPMLLRAQSWLNMGDESIVYGFLHRFSAFRKIPMLGEQRAGLGLMTFSAVAMGYYLEYPKKLSMRLAFWFWLSIGILTVYTGRRFFGIEPWEAVYSIFPGAQAIRAVSRICLLTLIPAVLGLAYFFQSFDQHRILKGGLFVCIVLEQLNSTYFYDKKQIRREVEKIAQSVPEFCQVFFYSPASPPNAPDYKLQLDAMWAGLLLNKPTLNGMSGNSPKDWGLFQIGRDPDPQASLLSSLYSPSSLSFKNQSSQKLKTALDSWVREKKLDFDPQCWVR
jgi:hypothetical protein